MTLWTAESYAGLVALHLTDPQALDELLARRDGLTGCLTDDGTRHELDREINRSARDGLRLSVCVIDLDDFLGHRRRNAMLALSAGIVRTNVRSCDTVGRYGGSGLVAILPQTSRNEARHVAERLRLQLANSPSAASERAPTPSLGVAQWTSGTPSEDLLAAADSALLAAKRSARLIRALGPGMNTTLTGRRPTAFSDPYDGSEELMKPIAALVLTIALLVPATALASGSSTCQAYSQQTCNVVSTTQTTAPQPVRRILTRFRSRASTSSCCSSAAARWSEPDWSSARSPAASTDRRPQRRGDALAHELLEPVRAG